MDNLFLKKNNKQVGKISYQKKKELLVLSEDENIQKRIKKIVDNFSKHGIATFTEPEKKELNKITIIRQQVFPDDPRFLEYLGKEFKNLGYSVIYVQDGEEFKRKSLENEIRRLLDSLEVDKEAELMRKEILKVIPKMSLEQLITIKKDLKVKG